MNALIEYALRANLAMAVMLVGYLLLLRRSAWFSGRRAWLLGTALLPLVLPLLPSGPAAASLPAVMLPVFTIGGMVPRAASHDTLSLLLSVHFGIASLFMARLAYQAWWSLRAVRIGGSSAISFFNRIHVPEHTDPQARAAMLAHERAHGELGHTCDILILEVLAALFWSNPLWRLALRELRLVHEHQADARAAASTTDYRIVLVAQAMNTDARTLLNRFNSSNLKTRLNMLDRTDHRQRARFLLALPLLTLSFLLTSADGSQATAQREDASVFIGHEQAAEFPGGMEALMKFLASSINYPDGARKDGLEGVVYIAFRVKANGKVTDAKVKRGVRADLDTESLRVVNEMPDWKPAMSGGKAVDSEMTLPIAFRLGDK